jgi:ribosomal protein S24E
VERGAVHNSDTHRREKVSTKLKAVYSSRKLATMVRGLHNKDSGSPLEFSREKVYHDMQRRAPDWTA